MKKRMAKSITLESLAAMIKEGFDEIHRIMATKEEMNKRFLRLETEMHNGFSQTNKRLDEIENNTRHHNKELVICRHHRVLTDARLDQLESAR